MRAKRDSNSHSIVLQTISLTNLDIRSYLNIIFMIDSREDINNRNINIPIIAIIYLIFNFFIVLNLKKGGITPPYFSQLERDITSRNCLVITLIL